MLTGPFIHSMTGTISAVAGATEEIRARFWLKEEITEVERMKHIKRVERKVLGVFRNLGIEDGTSDPLKAIAALRDFAHDLEQVCNKVLES